MPCDERQKASTRAFRAYSRPVVRRASPASSMGPRPIDGVKESIPSYLLQSVRGGPT